MPVLMSTLVLELVVLAALILLAAWRWLLRRRALAMDAAGARLMQLYCQTQAGAPDLCLAVRVASPRRFGRLFKLSPWDHAGLLVIRPDRAMLVLEQEPGTATEIDLPRAAVRVSPACIRPGSERALAGWLRLSADADTWYVDAAPRRGGAGESPAAAAYRALSAWAGHDAPDTAIAAVAAPPFAIERDRHAVAVTALALVLLLYAIVDGALLTDSYVSWRVYPLFALAGIAVWASVLIWLRRAALPWAENLALAGLLAITAAVALYLGALRINHMTDTQRLTYYGYFVHADGVLRTPNPALPVIDALMPNRYWRALGRGRPYVVQLRRGVLGFYQINMQSVLDDMAATAPPR